MKKALIFLILLCLVFLAYLGIVKKYNELQIAKTNQELIKTLIETTDPPSAPMLRNMEEQIECAKRAGFLIKEPVLRIMRPPYDDSTVYGLAYMDINVIVLINYAGYETLAHELGHIVDGQTHRKGHPFFKGKEEMDIEVFANAVKDVILKECNFVIK